jgi:hypothetical protein
MNGAAGIPDAIRKACEAYVEGLAAVMRALANLPREGGEAHRRMVEQWLILARTSKDSFVAALNQSLDLWERECRRAVGAPHAAGVTFPGGNPLEGRAETWKRGIEMFAAGPAADAYREAVRRQGELVQQSLEEGMPAWQRLWQPAERK